VSKPVEVEDPSTKELGVLPISQNLIEEYYKLKKQY
jgi:hypothetical protein